MQHVYSERGVPYPVLASGGEWVGVRACRNTTRVPPSLCDVTQTSDPANPPAWWKIKKSRCLGYFRMLAHETDMSPRAPLAALVVCLGNSNRAFGSYSGPEVTTRGQTTVWMPTAYILFPLEIWGLCGDFWARIRPQTPGSSYSGIQPSRQEGRAGLYWPPGIACENTPKNEICILFSRPKLRRLSWSR
jgi:hypothetical protein